jgi:hypothetical protein
MTMIRHSDTVNSMISARAHAAILRRVASTTVRDARAAWKRAYSSPTERRVRAAYRACVLASQALRHAAPVAPNEADEMLAEALRIDEIADGLRDQLVRIVEA